MLKKILILGSEGFIGSNLVQYFLKENYNVVGCDISEASKNKNIVYIPNDKKPEFWNYLFTQTSPDICINAAGNGSIAYSIQYPLKDFEANCYDLVCVLEAIRLSSNFCKYLHISSAAVYGNPTDLPVREDGALNPISPYGWHKLQSENICREYSELYGINIAIIRPFSVYGNGLKKQLLWDICEKLRNSDRITLYGTGNETRDFIHINDLAKLIQIITEKDNYKCEIYNAASGIEVSVNHVAIIMKQNFDDSKNISFSGETKQGDPLHWQADISKITTLGFKPIMDFNKNLMAYVDWFKRIINA